MFFGDENTKVNPIRSLEFFGATKAKCLKSLSHLSLIWVSGLWNLCLIWAPVDLIMNHGWMDLIHVERILTISQVSCLIPIMIHVEHVKWVLYECFTPRHTWSQFNEQILWSSKHYNLLKARWRSFFKFLWDRFKGGNGIKVKIFRIDYFYRVFSVSIQFLLSF